MLEEFQKHGPLDILRRCFVWDRIGVSVVAPVSENQHQNQQLKAGANLWNVGPSCQNGSGHLRWGGPMARFAGKNADLTCCLPFFGADLLAHCHPPPL